MPFGANRGTTPGKLQKPRAITIDKHDHLYIVDITPQIQVFTPDGEYLRGWQTPKFANGKPSGLSFSRDGNLLVSDTHYARVLCYTPEGKLLENRTIGGKAGEKPGEFSCVTDCLEDSKGNYYVSEYGEWDRIQKFTPQRKYVLQWGGHGKRARTVAARKRWTSTNRIRFGSLMLATTGFRSSMSAAASPSRSKHGGRKAPNRASYAIPTTSCSTARGTSICANSAITGCKNSRWMAT